MEEAVNVGPPALFRKQPGTLRASCMGDGSVASTAEDCRSGGGEEASWATGP